MTKEKKNRFGAEAKTVAPPGFYTSKQARDKLGMAASTFIYYVKRGKIKRYVPPLKKEGYYAQKEIDRLATEMALFLHTFEVEETQKIVTREATPEDAQGIYNVLVQGFGWQAAPVELRLAWYKVNPHIDYVVSDGKEISGYVTAVPYVPEAMQDIMSGKRRAWDMLPSDILPYTPGEYDLYVGIAVKQIPNHTTLAFRLMSGFFHYLEDMAEQGIIIRCMYAVSAEPDGQKLCKDLGFVQQAAQPGDMFPRFLLDLQSSDSHFARRYREVFH